MQVNKRGSALLIVLGFLSFMVVSAVAFSIYMRSERMPSSVFRRNAQTRQLVKAGLAHAMSEIDDAIRDDKYPGLVTDRSRQMNMRDPEGKFSGNRGRYFDLWYGRVFMPPNPDYNPDGNGDPSFMADPDETVSVLNLEALGYLPPPLVNDVRFLARGSWSSKWRSFDYGAGRFAYCAVNVSDFVDVNRVPGDEARSSGSRINLSSFFADKYDNKTAGVGDAETFANFVDARGGTQSQWPFVSMLDYALGMASGKAGFESPFFRWIGQSSSGTMYTGNTDDAGDQLFVTDSWMPPTPADSVAAKSIVDLNDRRETDKGGQPFPQKTWMEGGKNFLQIKQDANSDFVYRVGDGRTPDGKNVSKSFSPVDLAMLYDYLDRDDMPVSLALPCVERAPMITGVSLENLTMDIALQGVGLPPVTTPGAGGAMTTVTETEFRLAPGSLGGFPGVQAKVSFLFPFKRASVLNGSYRAKALLRVFLVAKDARGTRVPRTSIMAALRPQGDQESPEWKASAFTLSGTSATLPPIVFTLVSDFVTLNLPSNVKEQDDAAFDRTFTFTAPTLPAQALLTKRETVNTAAPVPPATVGVSGPPIVDWKFSATPFDANGNLLYTSAAYQPEANFTAQYGGAQYEAHAAIWVVLENSAHDVVDLVPALAADDKLYNNVDNTEVAMDGYDGSGNGTPILRFRSQNTTTPGTTPDSYFNMAGVAVDQPRAYFAVDPRFNWAPEDYLPVNKSATGSSWMDWVLGSENGMDSLLGMDGHDSDIFMFVSNQGFLQSMGEFAFLPRVTNFGNQSQNGAASPVDLINAGSRYNGAEKTVGSCTWRDAANADCVWRTYRSYETAGVSSDHLLDFRTFVGGSTTGAKAFKEFGARGFRVNPYTDNEKIMMTAFAYTPYDWWAAAGTNTPNWQTTNSKDSFSQRKSRFADLKDSRDYVFCGSSSEAKISDEKIRAIARKICDEIRSKPGDDWENVYDQLPWYGNVDADDENSFRNFMGVEVDEPLHGVDRKYLHAFWRSCFANRQQLFLVFVRAESLALGGSGEGQIPPQQGGRAVALVWRDPDDPCNSSGSRISQDGQTLVSSWTPHRMRVLFFHQFD